MPSLIQRLFGAAREPAPARPREALIAEADRQIELGNDAEDSGAAEAALGHYRAALAVLPGYARAHLNVGNVLHAMGDADGALASYECALRSDPAYARALCNIGRVHASRARLADAESALRRALQLEPALVPAAIALADVRERAGGVDEAEAILRDALACSGPHAGALNNLALLQLKRQDFDAAEASFAAARAADPKLADPILGTAKLHQEAARGKDAEPLLRAVLAADPTRLDVVSSLLFSLNLRDDIGTADLFEEHRRLMQPWSAAPGRSSAASPDTRLRVGYVSGDLKRHPVALFLRPVLEHHDRARFEIHVYCNNADQDELTRELRGSGAHWHDIAGLSDAAVVDAIRGHRIDVLIDLSGHTGGNRLAAFAMRPAPVAASWLGYLNTSGLPSVDFRIVDRHTDPEGETERFNCERLVRLPHSQWCYAPVYDIPIRQVASNRSGPVFGSFNQFAKISDSALDLWCAVLRELPDATLRVYGVAKGRHRGEFLERMASRGVAPTRVSLFPRLGIDAYFAAIADVDVALDAFPYNGATTTLDTLWMGTPLVALRGERSIARGSYSILCSLDAPELIASSAEDYVARNVALAADLAKRAELRTSLRARMQRSPLMDAASFTADLETLLVAMIAEANGC